MSFLIILLLALYVSLFTVIYKLVDYFITQFSKKFSKKTVYIVRGLPGSGKKKFVYYHQGFKNKELGYFHQRIKNGRFGICYSQNYFEDQKYNPELLYESQIYLNQMFSKMLKNKITNIYILGDFSLKRSYSDLITKAQNNNYCVKIIEIVCPDMDHLNYFTTRTKKPAKKIYNMAKTWEFDNRALYLSPYIPDFSGDSLPCQLNYNQYINKLNEDLNSIEHSIQNKKQFDVNHVNYPIFNFSSPIYDEIKYTKNRNYHNDVTREIHQQIM